MNEKLENENEELNEYTICDDNHRCICCQMLQYTHIPVRIEYKNNKLPFTNEKLFLYKNDS